LTIVAIVERPMAVKGMIAAHQSGRARLPDYRVEEFAGDVVLQQSIAILGEHCLSLIHI